MRRTTEPVVLAIDPGPTQSAYAILFGKSDVGEFGKIPNDDMLDLLYRAWKTDLVNNVAIEMVQSFGKPVGAEVFQTCVWVGRFQQQYPGAEPTLLVRHEIKMHLCKATQGVNDAVIRQRLIDLYGGKEKAIGKKKTPGPLYGIKGDCWQALACGYVWQEKYGRPL